MANQIVAGNGTNNGLAVTSDNTGALNILTGSGAGTTAISIDSSQNVTVAGGLTTVGAIGYGTGAGGTVTQLTSKSTTVTLNKSAGQITMNNAALGAGASVLFQFSNSLFSSTDNMILTINNPISGYNYRAEIAGILGGIGVQIRVTNISAGSLSDALTINFAIIKSVTA